jgi:hypothetical protein
VPPVTAPQSDAIIYDEPRTPDAQPSEDIITSSGAKHSGRASRRKSLKTLISTKFMRNRVDSSTSHPDSPTSRKRWRSSRRFSKAPVAVNGEPQDVVPSVLENLSEELDAPVASSSTSGPDWQHADVNITPIDRPATPHEPSDSFAELAAPDLGITENEQGTSSNIGTWMGGQGSLGQNLGLPSLEEDEVVISPSVFTEEGGDDAGADFGAEVTDDTHTPTQLVEDGQAPIPTPLPLPPVAPDAQPSRQFPPPGTLVVVQGVVHTTDVSRPPAPIPTSSATLSPANTLSSNMSRNPRRASSYIPPSISPSRSEAGFPRSRRSSVFPRPASIRARPFSMVESSTSTVSSAVDNSDNEFNMSSDGETVSTSNPSGSDARTQVLGAGTPILSPSSIDVLGTLLRYASIVI